MRELLINEINFVSGGDLNHLENPFEQPYEKRLRETGQMFGADEKPDNKCVPSDTLKGAWDAITKMYKEESEETTQHRITMKTIQETMKICVEAGGNYSATAGGVEAGIKKVIGAEGALFIGTCKQPGS